MAYNIYVVVIVSYYRYCKNIYDAGNGSCRNIISLSGFHHLFDLGWQSQNKSHCSFVIVVEIWV